ncbi:LamG-like jellyroll fold domain-containing protein [Microlunatus ginsengisoli]|uniref:Glucose/arabinose dehydrogenase, beta-propeller fold n=1 Tax=Microlunatus ginsengisoli TaxID=363863 RepID=A0ABP6ZFC8_9ACTN
MDGWRNRLVVGVATFGLVLAGLAAGSAPAQAAPTGFSLENLPFTGLIEPVGVEFADTGQVFVAERRGVIKVFDNLDDSSSRTVADLRLRVFNGGDRGLLGMALDPQYPTRPYLWVLYAKDAEVGGTVPKYGNATSDYDSCPDGGANDCRVSGELSRLTLNPADGTWTNQESVLLSGWCQQYGSHSIGTVTFGTDGYLYVSAGDGASYNNTDVGTIGSERCDDPSPYGGALRSQSVRRPAGTAAVLNGAVLRLVPDTGAPAPGNPFASDPDPIRQRIIAYGMRNPFRIAPRPNTNQMWVADVGWNAWEEINRIDVDGVAKNFGWPCYEGDARQSGYDSANTPLCESLYTAGPAAVSAPLFTYNHGSTVGGSACPTGGSAVSAIEFPVNATAYPAAYRGGVFFGDYSRRCIWYANLTGSTIDTGSITTFDATAWPAELETGPNGDVYVVDIVANAIKRIRYNAGGNTPPIAIARADKTNGPIPLTVQFDGSGSSDPDAGSSISFAWDLDGDGAFDDSTAVSPTWTYSATGAVTARLQVTDENGARSVASVTVTAGSSAPVVTISSTATASPWKVGDDVGFTVQAADAEDGVLKPSAINTRLIIEHCPGGANCHEHVQQTFPGVASGSFIAPDHEYPCWLKLESSATDSSGITTTTNLRLDPSVVNLTIDSQPSGLQAVVGSDQRTTPFTVPVVQGSENTIAVPSPQTAGATYTFSSWSDNGAVSHNVVANSSTTYTARFDQSGTGSWPIAGLVGAWSFDEGTGSTAFDGSGQGNSGTVNGPTWTAAGKYGGALTFDGVNDRVDIPDRASLDLTTNLTLSAWVRPTTLRSWSQAVLKENGNGLSYALYATGETGNRPNGSLSIGGADRYIDATAGLSANTWAHLALTYDGSTMRLYVNGAQVASRAQSGAVPVSANPLRIGGNAVWGEWFSGQIDEVRVYNRALSATEVGMDSTTAGAPDTVPPTTPGGLSATGSTSSVALAWTASTDNRSTPTYEVHRSQVSGFSPAAATRIASGVSGTTYSDAPLAAGTYYYRVIASDGVNLSSPSSQAVATVTGDTTSPSAPGAFVATLTGTTATLNWSASTDDVAVTEYQVLRTGPDGSTTFAVVSPTTSLTDTNLPAGTYDYSVRARDLAGNWSAYSPSRTLTVVIDMAPPTVTVTSPISGATVSGAVSLTATAGDDVGIAGVQFRVDGTSVGAEDTSPPYAVSWSSAAAANGTHQITAVARDTAGKTTVSAIVSVSVANTGPSGLVGAWSFNEGTGTTAADSSGQGNNGTLSGGPTWTSAGKYGGAITFDGVNDMVAIPDANSLDLSNNLTVAAWVRPTAQGAWRTAVLKERTSGLTYALYANGATGNRPNGTLAIGTQDREVNGTTGLTANTWTHVALTYDGTTMRLYVNGTQVASRAQTGSAPNGTGPLRIGGNAVWGEWFTGQIDEVRVYSRALSAAEVGTIRDAPL